VLEGRSGPGQQGGHHTRLPLQRPGPVSSSSNKRRHAVWPHPASAALTPEVPTAEPAACVSLQGAVLLPGAGEGGQGRAAGNGRGSQQHSCSAGLSSEQQVG
jgi:hypothetical protein